MCIRDSINTVEKALEKALRPLEQSIENSLKIPGSLVIDGTLIPTWNWRSLGKINFSGKHKRAGFNHQVICTLDGELLAITDPSFASSAEIPDDFSFPRTLGKSSSIWG